MKMNCTTLLAAFAAASIGSLAAAQNPACNATAGDCCIANGTPGCNDPACCEQICAADPFCCDTQWDGICAAAAVAQCEGCALPPCDVPCEGTDEGEPCGDDLNGGCNMAFPLFGSISCGETVCGTAWAAGGTRDTDWYILNLPEATEVVITIFGGASMITGPVNSIDCATATAIDPFVISAYCSSASVVACLPAGDNWIFVATANFDGAPCDSGLNAYSLTVDCLGPCKIVGPCPSENDCCVASPTGTPGCNDEACCNLICAADPFCCDTQWDGICANAALAQCEGCALPPCDVPCEGTDEGEPCGDDLNGGCNMAFPLFGSISCGETVCGTAWAAGGTRDTDWYILNLPEATEVVITIFGGASMITGPVNSIDCATATAIDPFVISAYCSSASVVACLPAGDNWIFVATANFDGAPCDSGLNAYSLTVDCLGPCKIVGPCPSENDCCVASPTGTPGCNDEACCNLICAADPFCCDTQWDGICAAAAVAQCEGCALPPCDVPCEGTDEGEPCGDDLNGGCNMEFPQFGSISVGETICGTAWADGGTRDTDWFVLNLPYAMEVTITVFGGASMITGPVNSIDCATATTIDPFVISAYCSSASVVACLPAGDNWIFVATANVDGAPCGSGLEHYALTVDHKGCCVPGDSNCCFASLGLGCDDPDCTALICAQDPFCCDVQWDAICAAAAVAQCPVCAPVTCVLNPDLNCDGCVNGADIAIVLGNWNPTTPGEPGTEGDANCDGLVNGADIAVVLGFWLTGPNCP